MQSAKGANDALEVALSALADTVLAFPGCTGVSVMHDMEDRQRFVFTQTWTNREAHEIGTGLIPETILAAVMDALAGPPAGTYLDHVR